MPPLVTAILVAHQGGESLQRSIEAIRAQHRAPDQLIAVLVHPSLEAKAQIQELAESGLIPGTGPIPPKNVIEIPGQVSFGDAIRDAEWVLNLPTDDGDALWLLSEDCAPEPDALEILSANLERSPSVALVGPKLVDLHDRDWILNLGRSMTKFGRAINLVEDELDQGQHDELSDVLGVHPAGVLVRHSVWRQLGGFDRGLPRVDDGLDLGIRARLAGHRVEVNPHARVAFAEGGIAGPPEMRSRRGVNELARLSRRAVLHRRLVYAPNWTLALHWVSLLPLAILRSILALITKVPGQIVGEFSAAFSVMADSGNVLRSRARFRSAQAAGWAVVAPLRLQPDEYRRRRRIEADERRTQQRGRNGEITFLLTGGGWVLVTACLASVALFARLILSGGLSGGGVLPLSENLAVLWRNAAYGWRDIGAGFFGAADPFQSVLAALGTLTFWSPPIAILLLWVVAIPVAAMGAWFAASRIADSGALRTLIAVGWMAAPPFLIALGEGRPGAVLAHTLFGWLVFAFFGARTSWSAAGVSALLFAAVVASAPSLGPALIVFWLVALLTSRRDIGRIAVIPLLALVLWAPLIITQLIRGNFLAIFADPGLPVADESPSNWATASGFISTGNWQEILRAVGLNIEPRWILTVLVAPLIIAAIAAIMSAAIRLVFLALGVACAGYITAVFAGNLTVTTVGMDPVPVWAGSGQSLMWFGLLVSAAIAFGSLPRVRAWGTGLVLVTSVIAVVPIGISIIQGTMPVLPAQERELPAYVAAQARQDPRVTTLKLTAETDGGLRANLSHGNGQRLDEQSTLAATRITASGKEQKLANIAGNLASRSGLDLGEAINDFGIAFVLLEPEEPKAGLMTSQTFDRATRALNDNSALASVGMTEYGSLWRVTATTSPAPGARIPQEQPLTVWISIFQWIVAGSLMLLAIPTSAAGRRPAIRQRPLIATPVAPGYGGTGPIPSGPVFQDAQPIRWSHGEPGDGDQVASASATTTADASPLAPIMGNVATGTASQFVPIADIHYSAGESETLISASKAESAEKSLQ